jgi:hypothetical protein
MSFLNNMGGGAGALAGFQPNSISSGFGHMIGADPSRVSMIADRIGKAANGIAAGGGAESGYDGSAAAPQIDNHLQMLDPNVLQSIIARFRPQAQGYAR